MLKTPFNEFRYRLRSYSGIPALAYGAAMVDSQNAYGAWSQIIAGASVEHDIYGIHICINRIGRAGVASDALCDIGIDPAGGTSYTSLIPDLLCANASFFSGSGIFQESSVGGHNYYFPIFIPAGSSIAGRLSVNNASANGGNVLVDLYGQPSRPDAINVGRWVESIGITPASSSGTPVTTGTTSPGTWTSLGSPTRSGWYTQLGMGINDSTCAYTMYMCDLAAGDASNKRIINEGNWYSLNTGEQMASIYRCPSSYGIVSTSDVIYGRIQSEISTNSNLSLAAYVLGG